MPVLMDWKEVLAGRIVYGKYNGNISFRKNNDISIPKQVEPEEVGCFDNIIMNPPYSMKFPEADEMPIMGHKIRKAKPITDLYCAVYNI